VRGDVEQTPFSCCQRNDADDNGFQSKVPKKAIDIPHSMSSEEMGPMAHLSVRSTTLPADCELTFVGLVALTAVPLLALLGGLFGSREQRLGTWEFLVTDYPELRQTI